MSEAEVFGVEVVDRRENGTLVVRIYTQPSYQDTREWIKTMGEDWRWFSSSGWQFKCESCPELSNCARVFYIRGSDRHQWARNLLLSGNLEGEFLEAVEEANQSMGIFLRNANPSLEEIFFKGQNLGVAE